MNTQPTKNRRELLRDDITDQVRRAVREETADAASLREEDRSSIEDEVLSHTTVVLSAVTLEEMQSEGALCRHVANARCEANRLMRKRRTRPDGNNLQP